jgi:DNA-binding beta-propeller fold protein YncE
VKKAEKRIVAAGLRTVALGVLLIGTPAAAQERSYFVYVASESADEVSLLRFTPGDGLHVEKVISVGFFPAEMEGPHGINVDPTGEHWYLTLGHGFPFGKLLKYRTGADTLEGWVGLGLFPATVVVSPSSRFAFVVNSNFYGERVPSTVSVVDVESMVELDRLQTCTMPHGSRLGPAGDRPYAPGMIADRLVEIDVEEVAVARTLDVSPEGDGRCSPTWAAPTPDGARVYVMCNRSSEIIEVDRAAWRIVARWAAPRAPYNADVTPDGSRLVVTQKGSAEVSVWDVRSRERAALVPSTRRVTHGVAISPDSRYAFTSVEGVGGEAGAVDDIDLTSYERVASVDIGKQAGGIIFWRISER